MNYLVCLSTQFEFQPREEDKPKRRVHTRAQYINCASLAEAQTVADKLQYVMKDTVVDVGVMVWNGKGRTFIPCDTIAQVYDEMTHTDIEPVSKRA